MDILISGQYKGEKVIMNHKYKFIGSKIYNKILKNNYKKMIRNRKRYGSDHLIRNVEGLDQWSYVVIKDKKYCI